LNHFIEHQPQFNQGPVHRVSVKTRLAVIWILSLLISAGAHAASLEMSIEINLPRIDDNPYHRPFVAVWLEDEQRQGIETIAIWYNDPEWLKTCANGGENWGELGTILMRSLAQQKNRGDTRFIGRRMT